MLGMLKLALSLVILLVANLSAEAVELVWEGLEGAEIYEVQICKNKSCKKKLMREKTKDTSFRWLPRESGTYYWRVRGIDSWKRKGSYSKTGVIVASVAKKSSPSQDSQAVEIEVVKTEVPKILKSRIHSVSFLWFFGDGTQENNGAAGKGNSILKSSGPALSYQSQHEKQGLFWEGVFAPITFEVEDKVQSSSMILLRAGYDWNFFNFWHLSAGVFGYRLPISSQPGVTSNPKGTNWYAPEARLGVGKDGLWRVEAGYAMNINTLPSFRANYQFERTGWVHGPVCEWFSSRHKFDVSRNENRIGTAVLEWQHFSLGWTIGGSF